ncbi:MAG: DUF3810 family protein [Vicinamibacterales bacterium]
MKLWRPALVAFAVCAALVPIPSSVLERFYSAGVYRLTQPALTSVSNLVPFALFDVLVAGVVVGWVVLAVRDARRSKRRWLQTIGRIGMRTVVWSAALYVVFLLTWGLNYRRTRLQDRLEYDGRAVTTDGARRLGMEAALRLNALHDAAHTNGWPSPHVIDPGLADAFARANRQIGGGAVLVGRPKATWLDWYFRRASVDGMTDPYLLETLVSDDLLPFERPFVVAHEWSHLAGIADEGEANFLGWLTCVRGSVAHQYSGWLFLYQQVAGAVPRRDRDELARQLQAGPTDDLRAIASRIARAASPRLAAASLRAYDAYLKANRIDAGAASYAEVVRLVLGVRFGEDWTPRPAVSRASSR